MNDSARIMWRQPPRLSAGAARVLLAESESISVTEITAITTVEDRPSKRRVNLANKDHLLQPPAAPS